MTIIDVAQAAGVSKSTVSRVINGHTTVDPAIARRVREAMDEVGFVAKAGRRGPKPKSITPPGFRTGVVGLLVVGQTREHLEQPYVANELAGITEAIREHDLNLMIIEMPDVHRTPPVIRAQGVDGVLVSGVDINQSIVDMLHPLPCAWLGGQALELPLADHVLPNNPAVGILAADYLVEKGCRSFAYVSNVPMHAGLVVRRDAFVRQLKGQGKRTALFESATQDLERDLWQGDRMRADMQQLVKRILSRKLVPEGFFLPTDQQASVFQSVMERQGLAPEKDFVTVSCNRDEPWLAVMHPRAATIDTRAAEIGRTAARQLMRRIENPNDEVVTITVRPELVLPGGRGATTC